MMLMDMKKLRENIIATLNKPMLDRELVINACQAIAVGILSGRYKELLAIAGLDKRYDEEKLAEIALMLSRESLNKKLEVELGGDLENVFPLGVLFHIGAGNMDGLAAYSVIEGLLVGNINLVKLSGDDSGVSALVLAELVKQEPVLKEYIYVFAISQREQEQLKELAALADGVVVWGGDGAVSAFRHLVPPNCRLIEWGHKLSFAYITPAGVTDEVLSQLAYHIMVTKQLLCSSCQGIYLECEDQVEVVRFCKRLLAEMDKVFHGNHYDAGSAAQTSLKAYTYRLENRKREWTQIKGRGVNLFYLQDARLEAAIGYGNVWVKTLKRNEIIETLRPARGYLQTVGLVCGEDEREALTLTLLKAGATAIRRADDMSKLYMGVSHDGEYPLRRYSKIIDV